MIRYLFVLALSFYLLPLLINDTGSGMMMLLIVIPLICLVSSFFYGIRYSFNKWFAIIIAALFTPTIFLFYNYSAWVYIVGYGIIALIGNSIGMILYKQGK